jgi:hypothetical protein
MVTAILYLICAYLVASVWEATFHRHVLHARRHARRAWRRWGSVGALLRLAHFFHQQIHHRRTFRSDLRVQFDSAAQRRALDAHLKGAIGARARKDRYGLTVTGPAEFGAFVGPPLVFNTAIAVGVAPQLIWVGAVIATVPLLLSRHLHPLLHQPSPPPASRGLGVRLQRTRGFGALQRYHLLHHARRSVNFNLLPGADWLLGCASASRSFTPMAPQAGPASPRSGAAPPAPSPPAAPSDTGASPRSGWSDPA